MVLPVDVPNTPNLTWAVTKAVAAGTQVDGFTVTTRVKTVIGDEYSAQLMRQLPPVAGGLVDAATMNETSQRQEVIGSLPTPSFLADAKEKMRDGRAPSWCPITGSASMADNSTRIQNADREHIRLGGWGGEIAGCFTF